MRQEVPVKPPEGHEEDEAWSSWLILTPEQLEELEQMGRIDRYEKS